MAERVTTFRMVLEDLVSPTADKIASKLDGTVKQVTATVAESNAKISTMTTATDGTTAAVTKVGEEAKKSSVAVQRMAQSIGEAKDQANQVATATKKAGDETNKTAESTGRWAKSVTDTQKGMGILIKTVTLVAAAVKGVEIGVNSFRLASAYARNDFEAQVRSAQKLEDSIKSLPGGGLITDLGASINNLVTGEKDRTEEIQRQNEKLLKQIDLTHARLEESKDATTQAKAFTDSLQSQADSVYRTSEDSQKRQIAVLKKAEADILALPAFASGRAKQAADEFKKSSDDIIAHVQERESLNRAIDLRTSTREFERAQLESIHRVSEADRIAFVETLDQKQRDAAKLGNDFALQQERINNLLLANFDRTAMEKRRAFLSDLDEQLRSRALQAAGAPGDARQAESLDLLFKQQQERLTTGRSLAEQGATPAQITTITQQLEATQRLEATQLRVHQAVNAADDAQQKFSDHYRFIQSQVDSGQLGVIAGIEKTVDAQKAYTAAVDGSVAALQDLKAKATDPAQAEAIQTQIEKVKTQQQQAVAQVKSFGSETSNVLNSAIQPAFASFLSGTATAKQAFQSFLKSIATGFADLASKIATNLLIKNLLGGVLGTGAGTGAGVFAQPVGYAAGGEVFGSGSGDTVPALLTPGEFVLPRKVVQAVGVGYFESLRSRIMGTPSPVARPSSLSPSGLATGGTVAALGGGRSILPTLVADEPTLDRLLKGGDNALISALRRNREAVKQIVG